jgi:hypothetical protein
MIDVMCVWSGDKYGVEYVTRLRNMVRRHLPLEHRFICITDRENDLPDDIETVATDKKKWWGKIDVFKHNQNRRLFLDLDTVIVDDLTPLAGYDGRFAICENFTKIAGHNSWCDYGSCVMSLDAGWGFHVYKAFERDTKRHIEENPRGDQEFIGKIVPDADYLQSVTPPGYFLGYRDLTNEKPEGCAIVVFAGASKPHNCEHQWIKDNWK